ncbi:MAG: hypothetical protein ACLPYW_16915 [Acidimicrobiales bacterium]
MTPPRSAAPRPIAPRRRRWGTLGLVGLVLSVVALGCSRPVAAPPALPFSVPLPTSFSSEGAHWAIVPMGHLDSEVNTFWQLVVERPGSTTWVLATPPGVADNGGLVASGGEPRPLAIGFLTSVLLGFSPLAATSDTGHNWSGTVLPSALTPVPDALAGSPGGESLALLGRGGETVDADRSGLGSWRSILTRKSLSASPASSSCNISALTAVAIARTGSGAPVVGSTCSRRGQVGLFESSGGAWRDVGPRLTGALSTSSTEVVGITADRSRLQALVAARTGSLWTLIEISQSSSNAAWAASAGLAVPAGRRIQSIGSAPSHGLFVLLAAGTSASPSDEKLEVLVPPARHWQSLGAPPDGTQSVALAYTGGVSGIDDVEAFVADQSTLLIYRLESTSGWVKTEVMHVQIPYGSSS